MIPNLEEVRAATKNTNDKYKADMKAKYSDKIAGLVREAARLGNSEMTYDLRHCHTSKQKDSLFIEVMQELSIEWTEAGYDFVIAYSETLPYDSIDSIEVSWK